MHLARNIPLRAWGGLISQRLQRLEKYWRPSPPSLKRSLKLFRGDTYATLPCAFLRERVRIRRIRHPSCLLSGRENERRLALGQQFRGVRAALIARSQKRACACVRVRGHLGSIFKFPRERDLCLSVYSSGSGVVLENMLYPRPAILSPHARSPLALTAYGVSYEFACPRGGEDGLWHGCRRGSFWLTPSKEGEGEWGPGRRPCHIFNASSRSPMPRVVQHRFSSNSDMIAVSPCRR